MRSKRRSERKVLPEICNTNQSVPREWVDIKPMLLEENDILQEENDMLRKEIEDLKYNNKRQTISIIVIGIVWIILSLIDYLK